MPLGISNIYILGDAVLDGECYEGGKRKEKGKIFSILNKDMLRICNLKKKKRLRLVGGKEGSHNDAWRKLAVGEKTAQERSEGSGKCNVTEEQ